MKRTSCPDIWDRWNSWLWCGQHSNKPGPMIFWWLSIAAPSFFERGAVWLSQTDSDKKLWWWYFNMMKHCQESINHSWSSLCRTLQFFDVICRILFCKPDCSENWVWLSLLCFNISGTQWMSFDKSRIAMVEQCRLSLGFCVWVWGKGKFQSVSVEYLRSSFVS